MIEIKTIQDLKDYLYFLKYKDIQDVKVETIIKCLDNIKQCNIADVVSSCVDKETLIEDLDDKRIVGVTLNEDMWHYCRKETAEHLLDKYEIKTK